MSPRNKIQCELNRSACPITSTLDLIGDKWTLVIIRDMVFLGKKNFNEFLESPEGIATNILTDRLKKLEEYNVITKETYQKNPPRFQYTLTPHGLDLKPVLIELVRWGNRHIEGTIVPPVKLTK
jgi:DNA-binding HxlR family transcriptional regulator